MSTNGKGTAESRPVRLPGFLNEDEIGLGDVLKRVTSYVGLAPCGGCQARASTLNSWLVFSGASRNKNTLLLPK
jgi:hypothetical protein